MIKQPVDILNIVSLGDTAILLTEYIDAASALELSRTCVQLYQALSRNTSLGISIWRRYLSDDRYQTNRLTFEVGRAMTSSDIVSRANFKLILAVLVQKNGFMKIARLKELQAKGVLSTPILPHKGKWRALVRLDPFALKRASKEVSHALPEQKAHSSLKSSLEGFICQIAGHKSKLSILEQYLRKHLVHPNALSSLLNHCIHSGTVGGIPDILKVSSTIIDDIKTPTEAVVLPYRSALGNNIFHDIIRDPKPDPIEKRRRIEILLEIPCTLPLLNMTNYSHETPLIFASRDPSFEGICGTMVKHGANVHISDKNGRVYVPRE
jgi:hypothetical protein